MNVARLLAVAVSALTLGMAMVGVLVDSRSAGAPPATRLMTFRDHQAPLRLTIETEPSAANVGSWSFSVPQRGVYVGAAPAVLRFVSNTSTTVRYEGDADLISVSAGLPSATRLSVSLLGQLDMAHHTAQVTLVAGLDRFHLVHPAVGKGGVDRTLKMFETALKTGDWRAIYTIASSDLTRAYTPDAFVAAAEAQRGRVGVVTTLRRLNVAGPQTNPAGMTFFVSSYQLTHMRGDGTTSTSNYDAYFVLEGDAWRLWFTARR